MNPSKVEYNLGHTQFHQLLVLENEGQNWKLIQYAADQRDDTQRINLTEQQLRDIAEHFGSAKVSS